MSATIVHISDVHYESLNPNVSERLTSTLKRLSPTILVFTGDLVNNFWRIPNGKKWLIRLCDDSNLDPVKQLLIVPGNHDYRLWGTFGFKPVTGFFFRRYFSDWRKKIQLFPEHKLCFLLFDSNPLSWGFARGRVSRFQLSEMRRALFRLSSEDREIYRNSTKIALIHHHPLPVPFEGADRFLVSKSLARGSSIPSGTGCQLRAARAQASRFGFLIGNGNVWGKTTRYPSTRGRNCGQGWHRSRSTRPQPECD